MLQDTVAEITIEKTIKSKIEQVNFEELPFGKVFSDHMLICDYKNGKWSTPKIVPYGPFQIEPSARVFHYGQAVFEGMKAYKDDNGNIFMFRPLDNYNRLNKSAARLAMPELEKDHFMNGLAELLKLEKDWIKPGKGNSLYLRPFIIATEPAIAASPAEEYKFVIICSPAKSYYSGKVNVLFAQKYSRAANGGVGFAKAAGNYASQFYPTNLAKEKGYQQIIWTDANTHEYLEEAGTMNVFFRVGNKLITAPNNDRILDGITRKSIIQLAEDNNIVCEVRPVSVTEIKTAAKSGDLKEMFGAGTAAVISPISKFEHNGDVFDLPELENSYGSMLKNKILDIQHNITEDPYNWRFEVK